MDVRSLSAAGMNPNASAVFGGDADYNVNPMEVADDENDHRQSLDEEQQLLLVNAKLRE